MVWDISQESLFCRTVWVNSWVYGFHGEHQVAGFGSGTQKPRVSILVRQSQSIRKITAWHSHDLCSFEGCNTSLHRQFGQTVSVNSWNRDREAFKQFIHLWAQPQALKSNLVRQSLAIREFTVCILCMMLLVYGPRSVYVKHANGWTVSVKSWVSVPRFIIICSVYVKHVKWREKLLAPLRTIAALRVSRKVTYRLRKARIYSSSCR